jgi:hypothetical protein
MILNEWPWKDFVVEMKALIVVVAAYMVFAATERRLEHLTTPKREVLRDPSMNYIHVTLESEGVVLRYLSGTEIERCQFHGLFLAELSSV